MRQRPEVNPPEIFFGKFWRVKNETKQSTATNKKHPEMGVFVF